MHICTWHEIQHNKNDIKLYKKKNFIIGPRGGRDWIHPLRGSFVQRPRVSVTTSCIRRSQVPDYVLLCPNVSLSKLKKFIKMKLQQKSEQLFPTSRCRNAAGSSKGRITKSNSWTSQRLTLLSQSHSIVLQEENFQVVSDFGVVVDNLSNRCDQLDDHLGGVVTWSRLEKRGLLSASRRFERAFLSSAK